MYYIIKVREDRRGNKEWKIQRHWPHLAHRTEIFYCSVGSSMISALYGLTIYNVRCQAEKKPILASVCR